MRGHIKKFYGHYHFILKLARPSGRVVSIPTAAGPREAIFNLDSITFFMPSTSKALAKIKSIYQAQTMLYFTIAPVCYAC